jgi:hypothetical protein
LVGPFVQLPQGNFIFDASSLNVDGIAQATCSDLGFNVSRRLSGQAYYQAPFVVDAHRGNKA